jgi:response regulator NasT
MALRMTLPLKTIGFADDERGIRDLLQLAITDLGYQVAGSAQNGLEAVELVRRLKPNVILLDIHMPGLEGEEAARQIIALETTAVVILTADTNPVLARRLMDMGAAAYMVKPFSINQIGAAVESAWHRFQTVSGLLEERSRLNETLEVRKLMEKAKGILIEQQHLTEEEAHRTILKMSQDQGLAVKEVCRSILQVKMLLGQGVKSKENLSVHKPPFRA